MFGALLAILVPTIVAAQPASPLAQGTESVATPAPDPPALPAAPAPAAPAPPPPAAPPTPAKPAGPSFVPYTGAVLVTDLVSYALFSTALALDSDALGWTGLVWWLAAVPVVHGVHGNPGRPALSVVSRALMPVAGFLVGYLAAGAYDEYRHGNEPPGDYCCDDYNVYRIIGGGIIAGFLSATAIDAFVLARRTGAPAAVPRSVSPVPMVGPSGSTPTFGFALTY